MYFTKGKQRAFELLMQQKPGFDRYQSGCAGDDEDCGTCCFYRPGGNTSFALSKSVPIAPAKGRGKHPPVWTNRRAKGPCVMWLCRRENGKGLVVANAFVAGEFGLCCLV